MLPLGIMLLRVYASEVAACVGFNRFCTPIEQAEKVWKRNDPEGYKEAAERNSVVEKPDILVEIEHLQLNEKVISVIKSTNHETYRKELDNVLVDLDGVATPEVTNEIRSFIFTERGKGAEQPMLEKLEKTLNTKITQRNDKFYKVYLEYGNGKKMLLGGKVDGVTEDNILVEVKNRQYRLFPDIPTYEKIQVHVYMYLTGISECYVVQYYKERESRWLIEFDEEFWKPVLEKLTAFAEKVSRLVKEKQIQDKFFTKKEDLAKELKLE